LVNKRVLAEALGTSLLLYVIVGSGIAAETLSDDSGLRLFAHAISVGLGLGALIAMLQTVSGSHLNPSVTLAFWRTTSMEGREASRYIAAQVIGAIAGVLAANVSFNTALFSISTTRRGGLGLVGAEAVTTFILVLVILALARTGRPRAIPIAVGAWVAAAVYATSSTGFANPAVTIARIFTDTFTGIAPSSVPAFLAAQVIAGFAAASVATVFYPEPARQEAPA
jgi:glycerol uptake facilitator-like aquaporin